MLELPPLELVAALFTGAAALTLIPHRRSLLGSIVELAVWVGFVLASGLCLINLGDPKIQESTISIAWGAAEILRIQAAFVLDAVRGWMVAQRFPIADWVAIAAGVDVLALAFVAAIRTARSSQPRIHLGDWSELPGLVARPVVVPVVDPLAAIDERLAAAARTELRSIQRGIQTSPTLARAAVGAAHLLGPGHLRLMMVKLAINVRLGREALAGTATSADSGGAPSAAIAPSLTMATRRSPHRRRRQRTRRGKQATAAGATPFGSASRRPSGAAGGTKRVEGNSSAPALRDRLAS